MPIIQVDNVSMRFNLAQEKTETLKEYTVKLLKHQLFFNEFYALQRVLLHRARRICCAHRSQRQRQKHDAQTYRRCHVSVQRFGAGQWRDCPA